MDTITMKLDRLFRRLEKDSYPGEYLDFMLREKPNLGRLEEIALVLASYSRYWNDKDATIFNNDQRKRIFSCLAGHAENSAVIAAVLSALSEADGESNEPFFKEERRREQKEKYLLLAKSTGRADSALSVIKIRPELLEDYREILLSFLEKADAYKDERILCNLANLPRKDRERLKSKVATALSKLLYSNVTPASSAYKTLSRRFTDREIRYLNLKWFQGTGIIQDKVIAEFLSSLLLHENGMPINDWEERLFRQYGTREFCRNMKGSCRPYDYLCREYLLRGRPCILQDEESWELAYELYSAENITEDWSFLKFNPMEKENFERILCVKSKESQANLINDFVPKKEQTKKALIPDYTEEEKKYAERMKQISQNVFGDEFMDVLDKYYCYNAMTFLCQTEMVPEPDKITNWVQKLQGGYGVCCTVRICKKTSKAPTWLIQFYDLEKIIKNLNRETMCGVSKEIRREYIGQLFDALYLEVPYYYVGTLMELFKEDWKWRNPKEGDSPEPEFQLTDFFTDGEIRILVSGLRNQELTPEEEACINHYRMDKEEYNLWQSRKKKREQDIKDQKALYEFQKNANRIFKRLLENNCEAAFMERCYRSDLCKAPKQFKALFEKTITGLATARTIEKFEETGAVPILLSDMAEISKSEEGIKMLPTMMKILEKIISGGEKHGAC